MFIVIPSIVIAIIIGIIVCCCICLRKRKTEGTVGYSQPSATAFPPNPMTYPNIASIPINQENLLFSNPSWNNYIYYIISFNLNN